MPIKVETCGVATPTGTCTMPKGHSAPFHRNRQYVSSMEWVITSASGKTVLKEGRAIIPLNEALSELRKTSKEIIIKVKFG